MNKKNIILKSIFILIAFFITIYLLSGLNYLLNYDISKKISFLDFQLDFFCFFGKFMLIALISGSFIGLCLFSFKKLFQKLFE